MLDLNNNLTSFDDLNKFTENFTSKLKSKYDSIILKMDEKYQTDKTYIPYDLLTFFDLYYKDKVIVLDKAIYSPDLAFIFHFLCHTNKSEIRVVFDINKINSLVEYANFKHNIKTISECISYNGFDSVIHIIQPKNDGRLNDFANFIKDIKNVKLSFMDEFDEKVDLYVIMGDTILE